MQAFGIVHSILYMKLQFHYWNTETDIHTSYASIFSSNSVTILVVIPNTCFMILQGGQYILTLVDFYGVNFTVFILGTIEVIGIAWIYGEFILYMSKVI